MANENAQAIYDRLRRAGMAHAGATAMLGNMKAESALRPNNAQDGMTRLTDEQYTESADHGAIDFVNDAVGYGLCQWTFNARKKGLLEFAKLYGVSVGDLNMQVDYCVEELKKQYHELWQYLCYTTDSYTATARICKEFERPAVNNIDTRYKFATEFSSLVPTRSELFPNMFPELIPIGSVEPEGAVPSDNKQTAISLIQQALALLENM